MGPRSPAPAFGREELAWLGGYKAYFGCHDIRNFWWAASPIKMRQRPDMIIAVDRDLKTKHDIDAVRYLYWSCFP